MATKQSKTVEVMLPLSEAGAKAFLRRHAIPFTHMRAMSGGGVMFRIRRGYALDFRHLAQKHGGARIVPNKRKRSAAKSGSRRARRNKMTRGIPTTMVGKSLGVEVWRIGGYVSQMKYEDATDHKAYYHDFEGDFNAAMYLVNTHLGRSILIVPGDGQTPLWEPT